MVSDIKSENQLNQSFEYPTKIKDQTKRLCAEDNYISQLESRLKYYNPSETLIQRQSCRKQNTLMAQSKYDILMQPNQLGTPNHNPNHKGLSLNNEEMKDIQGDQHLDDQYRKLLTENKCIEKEKEEIASTLNSEIIINDKQRNQIEMLKQTIETSLIQLRLKSKLVDLIKQNYYNKEAFTSSMPMRMPNDPKDSLHTILNLTSIMNHNDKLTAQCNRQQKTINQLELFKDKVRRIVNGGIRELDNSINCIVALENSNTILMTELFNLSFHNNQLKSQLNKGTKDNAALTKSLTDFKVECAVMQNEHENLIKEKQDYIKKIAVIELNNKIKDDTIHLLKAHYEIMLNEKQNNTNHTDQLYLTVKSPQNKYDSLLVQFFELKKHNQQLTIDNDFYKGECNNFKSRLYELDDLSALQTENKRLFCILNESDNEMKRIENERCSFDLDYKGKVDNIINNKTPLMNKLCKQANELNVRKRYQMESKASTNQSKAIDNSNSMELNKNTLYYNCIRKVIKCLIGNQKLQNMLFNVIDLNDELINLSS